MEHHARKNPSMESLSPKLIGMILIILVIFIVGGRLVKTIPAGHVGVVTLFGKVSNKEYSEGIHIVNPLYKWTLFDIRNKSHMEQSSVPTQDQLRTTVDVSVQYNINGKMAPLILRETGTASSAIEVHLVPKLRSVIREQGKTIARAEDFFREETQQILEVSLKDELTIFLEPKGIIVQAVLLRDIVLPPFITKAIEAKKEREQEVEKQKAELERFRTEQEQQIAHAVAKRKASEEQAAQIKVLADAKAYEIEKLNNAIGQNASYIQLQSIEALKAISKDPAAKVYFINGDSPSPLPLMHLGERK